MLIRRAALLFLLIAALLLCAGCTERPRQALAVSLPSPDGRERNIFFHYHLSAVPEHSWLDNDTVLIGHQQLRIDRDYYECFDDPSNDHSD